VVKNNSVTCGIAWNPATLEKGKARAVSLGRSLSNYVNQLVTEDLGNQVANASPSNRKRNKQRSN